MRDNIFNSDFPIKITISYKYYSTPLIRHLFGNDSKRWAFLYGSELGRVYGFCNAADVTYLKLRTETT